MINYLTFIIAMLLVSCTHTVKPQEDYDAIIISEYDNTYDKGGRLSKVIITETKGLYAGEDNKLVLGDKSNRVQFFSYTNDTVYSIKEITGILGEIKTIKFTEDAEEELLMQNGKDTLEYSYKRYYRGDKDKCEYMKMLWRSYENPTVVEGFESCYYYDNDGNKTKSVNKDFDENKVMETYYFEGIEYKDAIQRIPKSANSPDVVCGIKTIDNDTIIIHTTYNGTLENISKEFTDGKKKINQQFDSKATLTGEWTDYRKDGLKISVSNVQRSDGFKIDSIFYKNDKKLRDIQIDSNSFMKTVTNSVYDDKGNLLKVVTKIKQFNT